MLSRIHRGIGVGGLVVGAPSGHRISATRIARTQEMGKTFFYYTDAPRKTYYVQSIVEANPDYPLMNLNRD